MMKSLSFPPSNGRPYGFIYETAFPDGRYYRGQHKIENHDTLDPKYMGSGVVIRDYIKSKGRRRLSRMIWAFASDQDELDRLEALYIPESLLLDPLCLNLEPGGARSSPRTEEIRSKISTGMAKARSENPDNWPSRKGHENNKSAEWLFISPDNQIHHVIGSFTQMCVQLGLSAPTMSVAFRQGWIPKRGQCSGWQVFNLTTMQGTVDQTKNHGAARSGVNNPSHKAKLKRQLEKSRVG